MKNTFDRSNSGSLYKGGFLMDEESDKTNPDDAMYDHDFSPCYRYVGGKAEDAIEETRGML